MIKPQRRIVYVTASSSSLTNPLNHLVLLRESDIALFIAQGWGYGHMTTNIPKYMYM